MSQGLRHIWGLGDPQAMDAAGSEQGQQFRESFAKAVAVINESLKQTAPYAPSSEQATWDAQRKALYAAYQKVVNSNVPAGDADRVLAAAESLRDKAQSYMHQTESARQVWSERETELQQAMDKVIEMEENDHEKSDKLREVIEKIQSHAYEGNYGESNTAVDQFLPKVDPIYEDFRRKLGEYGGESVPGGSEYGSDVIDHSGQYPDMGYVENTSWSSGLSGKTGQGLEGATNVAGDLWDSAKDKASEAWDDTSDAASDAKSWVEKKAGDAADWASDTADDAKKMATGGDSRPLTEDEIAYAKEVFGENIDYSKIRVVKGSVGSLGNTPRTIGDSVHMTDGEFEEGTMKLSKEGLETLIHEMTHVHQYQKDGWEYAPKALWEQAKSYVLEGDRGHAYEWERAEAEGIDPTEWNPEQQGSVVEEYNKLLRYKQKYEKEGKALNQESLEKMERMKKHVDKILNAPPKKDIIDEGVEAAEDAWDWTKDTAEEAVDAVTAVWDSATDKASELWNDATESVDEGIESAKDAASEAWDETTDKAAEIWDSATETASEAWDSATETAGDLWDSATDKATDLWDNATETASEAWDGATETASEGWDAAKETAGEVWDTASNTASDAANTVQETASEVYDTVSETASNAYDTASNTASEAVDYAGEKASEAVDYASEKASEAVDTVSDAASETYDDAKNAAGKAWDSMFG